MYTAQLSLLRYDEEGQLDQSSIVPVIDGGTEGEHIDNLHLVWVCIGVVQVSKGMLV